MPLQFIGRSKVSQARKKRAYRKRAAAMPLIRQLKGTMLSYNALAWVNMSKLHKDVPKWRNDFGREGEVDTTLNNQELLDGQDTDKVVSDIEEWAKRPRNQVQFIRDEINQTGTLPIVFAFQELDGEDVVTKLGNMRIERMGNMCLNKKYFMACQNKLNRSKKDAVALFVRRAVDVEPSQYYLTWRGGKDCFEPCGEDDIDLTGNDGKPIVAVQVQKHDTKVLIVNVHLQKGKKGVNKAENMLKALCTAEWCRDFHRIYVMGDFNHQIASGYEASMFCREGRHPEMSRGKRLDWICRISPRLFQYTILKTHVSNAQHRRDFHLEIVAHLKDDSNEVRSDHALIMTDQAEDMFAWSLQEAIVHELIVEGPKTLLELEASDLAEMWLTSAIKPAVQQLTRNGVVKLEWDKYSSLYQDLCPHCDDPDCSGSKNGTDLYCLYR